MARKIKHILPKCKTFQCDSSALSDRDNFRELNLDFWLVFTHHTWRREKKSPKSLTGPEKVTAEEECQNKIQVFYRVKSDTVYCGGVIVPSWRSTKGVGGP